MTSFILLEQLNKCSTFLREKVFSFLDPNTSSEVKSLFRAVLCKINPYLIENKLH